MPGSFITSEDGALVLDDHRAHTAGLLEVLEPGRLELAVLGIGRELRDSVARNRRADRRTPGQGAELAAVRPVAHLTPLPVMPAAGLVLGQVALRADRLAEGIGLRPIFAR
jgi:hypothetical protein